MLGKSLPTWGPSTFQVGYRHESGGLQSMGSQRVGHRVTKQLVATLVAQTVKTLPAMQETRVQ